jgi:hypothetical protein
LDACIQVLHPHLRNSYNFGLQFYSFQFKDHIWPLYDTVVKYYFLKAVKVNYT